MHQRRALIAIEFVCLAFCARSAQAQSSATYHLHKDASKTAGVLQLKTAPPDAGAATIASADLRRLASGEYLVKAFDTAAGVPNAAGTIPAGSVVSLVLWMKKSANAAVMYPRAKLFLNSQNGPPLCTATAANALTTTIASYALNCATPTAVAMSATDRFYLWVGVNETAAPGTTSVKAQLSIEGVLNGNYDSRIVAPLPISKPVITSITPTSATVGAAIAIAGINFGTSQSTSRVTFNGIAAAPASWTATAISAPVPAGAASGPVIVSVGGLTSNAVPFVVITDGSIGGVVSRAADRSAVAGALVELLREDVPVAQDTTAASGQYTLGPVPAGTYSMRVSAGGLAPASRSGIAISAGNTRTEDFALVALGVISGRVLQSATGAPVRGATVTAIGDAETRSTESDVDGAYALANLAAGAYAMSVRADGYRRASAPAVGVADGNRTTQNFSLDRGPVTYAYDELDRLIAVVDPSGTSAAYRYDAAGNILSIARQTGDTPSIFGFAPRSGPAATAVTIAGTAFSADAGGNSVRFNGVAAPVVSATETQILTTVPAGATTGPITVETGGVVAASSTPFSVLADDGRPTITGFSPPIVESGAPLLITGSNFDVQPGHVRVSENRSSMGGLSVRANAIEAALPADATSGHVEVRTPAGAAVSDGIVFVPPPLYSADDVAFTASATIGETIQVPKLAADAVALVAFDAVAGERIAIRQPTVAEKALFGPQGRALGSFWSFLATTLPVDGTYTVVHYQCYYQCDGSDGLTLAALPPDVTATVVIDAAPFAFDLTAAGQRARLTFTARSRQHITIGMPEGSTYVWASLIDANGFNLFGDTEYFALDDTLEAIIADAGAYTLILDPEGRIDAGHFSVALHDVADVTVNLTLDGAPVTATTFEAEADIYALFAGTAGDRVAIAISDVTLPKPAHLTIASPDRSILIAQTLGTGAEPVGGWIEFDLPATGTYTVFIDVHPYVRGGSATLEVFTRGPDLTGTIEIGGPPLTLAIEERGQNATVMFSGQSGQHVTVWPAAVGCEMVLWLYRDGETYPIAAMYVSPSSQQVLNATLPGTGSYRLLIDPLREQTGSITLSITSP